MRRELIACLFTAQMLIAATGCATARTPATPGHARDDRARREACETIQASVAQGMQPVHMAGCDLPEEDVGY